MPQQWLSDHVLVGNPFLPSRPISFSHHLSHCLCTTIGDTMFAFTRLECELDIEVSAMARAARGGRRHGTDIRRARLEGSSFLFFVLMVR